MPSKKPKSRAVGISRIAQLKPGTLNELKTNFLRSYQEESLCAAYNGFVDIGTFRQFLVSGAFLVCFNEFRTFAKHVQPSIAFELLRDDYETVISVNTYEAKEKWPISDANENGRLHRNYRLANVLGMYVVANSRPTSSVQFQRVL